MQVITLLTDFGSRDWFVGAMKGVIAAIAPDARVIDLTHEIPPGDVRAGAFTLRAAAPCFPSGAIHMVVVDPGVGSDRRALAIRTAAGIFLGPDNGVLAWAVSASGAAPVEVRHLANRTWWRCDPPSRTFHGRDIFAPAAAHLAAGAPFAGAGPIAEKWQQLPWPEVVRQERGCAGEVVYVDRFGNAITNLPTDVLPSGVDHAAVRIHAGSSRDVPWRECYAAVPVGSTVAVAGSSGLIEVAINGGDAARTLGLRVGSPVSVAW